MRCHICDKALSEAEIQVSPDKVGYEPCSICMEVVMDTAYSDGFVRPDDTETDPDFGEVAVLEDDHQSVVTDYDTFGYQDNDDAGC